MDRIDNYISFSLATKNIFSDKIYKHIKKFLLKSVYESITKNKIKKLLYVLIKELNIFNTENNGSHIIYEEDAELIGLSYYIYNTEPLVTINPVKNYELDTIVSELLFVFDLNRWVKNFVIETLGYILVALAKRQRKDLVFKIMNYIYYPNSLKIYVKGLEFDNDPEDQRILIQLHNEYINLL